MTALTRGGCIALCVRAQKTKTNKQHKKNHKTKQKPRNQTFGDGVALDEERAIIWRPFVLLMLPEGAVTGKL